MHAARGDRKRSRLRSVSTFARWAASMPLAVALGFFLGAQGPAHSDDSAKVAPLHAVAAAPDEKPVKPKAPVQVEMPAPPPIKYFPGLEEPLVATGQVTDEEGKDLDAALASFHDAPAKAGPNGDFDDYAKPLLAFITHNPNSNWNAALYLDLALGYYHAGYYSRTFDYLEKSWKLGRNATHPMARLMVDRAVGELARMHARLGHEKEIEALFADIGKRPMGGPATELIQGAHEGLWTFHNNPGMGYLCGPMALKNLLISLKGSPTQIKVAEDARSGPHGVSLPELAALADKAKLKYTLIHRDPGQPVPVPSVIHWNLHHYAAVINEQGGLYGVQDPTFGEGGGAVLTSKAIDAESSGYFLVPATVIAANPKAGWRVVSANSAEAKAVYGMGNITADTPGCSTCDLLGSQPSSTDNRSTRPPQMTIAQTQPMNVSLNLSDSPVGYIPQKGVPAITKLTYNARETEQPATLAFGNVSPKWTHSWIGWVWDDPGVNREGWNVRRYASGGGGYDYQNWYDRSGGSWPAESPDNSEMWRTPVLGLATNYEHRLPDGSKENFTLSDGATTWPRKLFLTSVTDARGNVTTLHYDASFRLTSVVDAMGRSTTFTYGLSGYPLLLTLITDPFGRTTQLTYDTSQRLASITDPVGITSSFTYSTSEPTFVTTLTTPYGTSTFNDTPNPNDTVETATRSLTLTDPLGYTDFYYFYQNSAVTPATDPRGAPTGMSTDYNGWLQWRNTYHWDPHEFTLGATMTGGQVTAEDFTKCDILHWQHDRLTMYLARALGSVKHPLEGRIYYNQPGTSTYTSGYIDRPSIVGRILDDGTSQETQATYNTTSAYTPLPGNLLSTTDPKGRVTQYTYATNNIDLLTVQQLTTSPSTYSTIATYGSYNTLHEPQTYTDAAGQVWQYTYNTAGQVATVTDPNSGVTTWNYDGSGRLSSIKNANSQTQVSYTYDSADRVQTKTDSEGYVLTYAYDNLDRVTKITYPDGTTDLYDYTFQSGTYAGTASLELRKHTDRLGRATAYGYDADRRLTSVTEPTSGTSTRTTNYDYYENGTLKDIIDANGNDTHWDVDLQSRPVKKTYAYGTSSAKAETYAYETYSSRLHSITDALGQVKTFAYGLDDRITGITYTSTVNATPNVTFAYDPYFPRLTSMTDGTGTTNYSYTAVGTNGALKLSSIAGPYSNDALGLTYDALGRLSGRNITGGNETFGYDAISRMTSHGTPLGSFTEGYLGQTNQMTSQSVTNGSTTVSTNWGYDTNTNDRRLISITNSGVSRSYTLSYLNGSTQNPYDIQSITDTAATGHPWATQSHNFTYDLIDRLLTANQTTPGNFTYAYDPLNNATTVTTPSVSVNPTYNGLNQLATWTPNTYSYDANGNMLSGDGVKTYKWDAENRLIEIDYTGTSNKSVFSYNGIGQRRVDAETNSGTTTTTRYLWCDDRVCQTRDGSDNVLRRDLQEGEYNVSTSQKLVYAPDQVGSTRDALDAATGNLVQSYDYAPYGAVTRSTGSVSTDYQYTRLIAHPASGMNLSTTRAQDGITGRWLNRDTIKETGGVNLYAYVGANTINDLNPVGQVSRQYLSGPWIDCGNGCRIRIDRVLTNGTDLSRHLAWECNRGKQSGQCGENGEPSHGGTWDQVPEKVKACAIKNGFNGAPVPTNVPKTEPPAVPNPASQPDPIPTTPIPVIPIFPGGGGDPVGDPFNDRPGRPSQRPLPTI
jgi:RHS repeat-associated protein